MSQKHAANSGWTVITGGSSGIGYSIALGLLRRGASVVIIGRENQSVEKALTSLKAETHDGRLHGFACEIGSDSEVFQCFKKIEAELGPIDVLINNAGFATYRLFEESTWNEIFQLFNVNMIGAARCIHAVLPGMIHRKRGHIINVASVAARILITPNAAYGASKRAMWGLSEALRFELEPHGIKVSSVFPGRVETPFFDHSTFKNRAQRRETKSALHPDTVSEKIIREVIEKKRNEFFLPWHFRWSAWLLHAFPVLVRPLHQRILRSRIRDLLAIKRN